ncbi:MAG: diaminopimelate decarboxylase [Desulfobacterales bacterium]|nr:diaminopimelate decarboxylase [Desulfobacterales bacterium]MDJ0888270.1 diaminopimelate decarboxylase [Desulfobacterales bacterium]MDJ0991088.1 diaminopimelate decarboxylase [Desulfobacterales bacterium]
MHHFDYRNGELYCEEVAVKAIADAVGTPFYLYSHATLKRHYQALDRAFDGHDRMICYSAKANTNLAVLALFARLGSGLDIVSGGELYRGLKAGFAPSRIVYSGVGKTAEEIDYALETGIYMLNVESPEELALIDQRARQMGVRAPIAVRVNPDVDPRTHPYISTGLKKNKFGMDRETALAVYRQAQDMENVAVKGIDCHIGSQITTAEPFRDALLRLRGLIEELAAQGIRIEVVDVGGGLGITYQDEAPPEPQAYGRAIREGLEGIDARIVLEPGRVIVGNAGVLVTRVLYRKAGEAKDFIVVDAGMNDLLRPSLYDAFHDVRPVDESLAAARVLADVVGPICETGDFLSRDRIVPDARRDDLLAVMSAGAYGFTMSSNYCSRRRAAEVMVRGDRFEVVRRRQNYDDLVAGETIPAFVEEREPS